MKYDNEWRCLQQLISGWGMKDNCMVKGPVYPLEKKITSLAKGKLSRQILTMFIDVICLHQKP